MATIAPAPLGDLRVVDASTWLGAYCGRLLADLGANVMSVGSGTSGQPADLYDLFHGVGKRAVDIEPTSDDDVAPALAAILTTADILLTDEGPARLRARHLHPDTVLARWPQLIQISISPYGLTGPWTDRPASDLMLLASGGLLYLAGDLDRPPVRPYGEQSGIAASLHATVGALRALIVRDGGGRGQLVDVSAQEAVAHSTENTVQTYDCENVVRRRAGV
jgi:benzylsuccinate CoA-transferase BbsE subunit